MGVIDMRTGQSRRDSAGFARFLRPVLVGTAAGMLGASQVLVLFSLLLSLRDIPQMAIGPMASAAVGLGALLGGFVSAKLLGERGLLAGFFSGLLFFVLLMAAGLLLFGGELGPVAFVRFLIAVVCASLGGFWGVRSKGRRK